MLFNPLPASGHALLLKLLMQMPEGYNDLPDGEEEEMAQFHVGAVNSQLQQVYHGLALALALNRTLVMPKVRLES